MAPCCAGSASGPPARGRLAALLRGAMVQCGRYPRPPPGVCGGAETDGALPVRGTCTANRSEVSGHESHQGHRGGVAQPVQSGVDGVHPDPGSAVADGRTRCSTWSAATGRARRRVSSTVCGMSGSGRRWVSVGGGSEGRVGRDLAAAEQRGDAVSDPRGRDPLLDAVDALLSAPARPGSPRGPGPSGVLCGGAGVAPASRALRRVRQTRCGGGGYVTSVAPGRRVRQTRCGRGRCVAGVPPAATGATNPVRRGRVCHQRRAPCDGCDKPGAAGGRGLLGDPRDASSSQTVLGEQFPLTWPAQHRVGRPPGDCGGKRCNPPSDRRAPAQVRVHVCGPLIARRGDGATAVTAAPPTEHGRPATTTAA